MYLHSLVRTYFEIAMHFQTHHDKIQTDLTGTFLQGYIQGTPAQLEQAFGAPLTEHLPDQVSMMWIVSFPGHNPISIYCRSARPAADEVTAFRIGAHARAAVPLVHEAFRYKLGLGEHRKSA